MNKPEELRLADKTVPGWLRRWPAALVVLPVVLGLAAPAPAAPADGERRGFARGATDEEIRSRWTEADALLRQGRWEAEVDFLRGLDRQVAKSGDRGEWLARLAVAEAGLGQTDQALWHWSVANDLASETFSVEDLRGMGAAGELLASQPRRRPGEVPRGVAIEPPGQELQDAVKQVGEVPPFSSDPWVPRQGLRLEIVIDNQGRPRDPVVLSARSAEAAYQALEALRDWRFSPATRHGQAVAVLHTVAINPPGQRPLAALIKLSAETAAIESKLRQGRWQEASALSEQRWYALLDAADPTRYPESERAVLGLTLAFRALAQAGLSDYDQALTRCRWEAAQSLFPSLYHLDLAPYGAAGEKVAVWSSETFKAPFLPGPVRLKGLRLHAIVKPEKISAKPPYYPVAARRLHLEGNVILDTVLDASGRVGNPVVVKPSGADDSVPFAASALDAVCDWRFKPATLDGKPVKVYYTLTTQFQIHGR